MRYLHLRSDDIESFILDSKMRIFRCRNDGIGPTCTLSAGAVGAMLNKSHELWGLILDYYLRCSDQCEVEPLEVKVAVKRVEMNVDSQDFLLIAYQDGGVISVSSRLLPFQQNATSATWWEPWEKS